MHKSSMRRMEWFAETYLKTKKRCKILDVGSYDVNGCYKNIFSEKGHLYEGLDMEMGPNVDICPKKAYQWEEVIDDNYDVVISGQALEHIEFFWVTIAEIVRVTKEGGIICLIAPRGFEEHRYPVDCWRFLTDGMIAIARFYDLEILNAHSNAGPTKGEDIWYSKEYADSMLVAKKNYAGKARICDLGVYKCKPANHIEISRGMATYEEHMSDKIEKECAAKDEKRIEQSGKFYGLLNRQKSRVKRLLRWGK